MEKRGQIAIFVIVAIVIVAVIIIIFALKNFSIGQVIDPTIQPIYNFVEGCVKSTAIDGLYVNGQRGGYYVVQSPKNENDVPYYVINNNLKILDKRTMESELGKYISNKLDGCVGNFSDSRDFRISKGKTTIRINPYIEDEKISINLDYPLIIKKGDTTWEVKEFKNIVVLTRYGLLNSIAGKIATDYRVDDGFSLIGLSKIYEDYNISTNLDHYANYSLVTLVDEKGVENIREPLEFVFAVE